MKRRVLFALTILIAAACGSPPIAKPVDPVKRGEYLVSALGCTGCHTPIPPASQRWTEAQFVATLRTGRMMGEGRALDAPMPWLNQAAASDDDLRAMFAYWTVQRGAPAVAGR